MSAYASNAAGTSVVGKPAQAEHFYPTPPDPTLALLRHYADLIGPVVYEPACGDGAISKLLAASGRTVISSDLVGRGFGRPFIDYLALDPRDSPLRKIPTITNPPFKYWVQFVRQAHAHEAPFIAMFAKAQVWNGGRKSGRIQLWHDHPPKAVHPLTWRVDFDGRGAPTMDCCWVVWGDHVPFSNQPFERE